MGALLARPVPVADLAAAVVRMYLELERDVTVKEIAEDLGCAESTVRRKLGECKAIQWAPSHPGGEYGVRSVSVYGPTRETLRQLVREYNQIP